MSVTAAKGFAAGAVHCGIRKKDRLDLALVHSLVPATGAGMFTVKHAACTLFRLKSAAPTAGPVERRTARSSRSRRRIPAATPELARVQATDAAEIGVFTDGATGTTIVICALDNLGKGAAGQAVQNANIALGLEQTLGLRLAGVLV